MEKFLTFNRRQPVCGARGRTWRRTPGTLRPPPRRRAEAVLRRPADGHHAGEQRRASAVAGPHAAAGAQGRAGRRPAGRGGRRQPRRAGWAPCPPRTKLGCRAAREPPRVRHGGRRGRVAASAARKGSEARERRERDRRKKRRPKYSGPRRHDP